MLLTSHETHKVHHTMQCRTQKERALSIFFIFGQCSSQNLNTAKPNTTHTHTHTHSTKNSFCACPARMSPTGAEVPRQMEPPPPARRPPTHHATDPSISLLSGEPVFNQPVLLCGAALSSGQNSPISAPLYADSFV